MDNGELIMESVKWFVMSSEVETSLVMYQGFSPHRFLHFGRNDVRYTGSFNLPLYRRGAPRLYDKKH